MPPLRPRGACAFAEGRPDHGKGGGVAPGHAVCPLGSWSYLVILAFKLAGLSCGISLHIGSVFVF